MSNLKKYLKVYKEDAQRANAFKQYMQIVSENQDFFAAHEVNEFFTDMIKDGTLVYDEGEIIDYLKNAGKKIPATVAAGVIALSSFLPSSLKAIDIKAITYKNAKIVSNQETVEKVNQKLDGQKKALKGEYESEKGPQREIVDKLVKENPTQNDIDFNEHVKLNTAFLKMNSAKLKYYDKFLKSIQSKQIKNLKVDKEDRDYLLKEIKDLVEGIELNKEAFEKLKLLDNKLGNKNENFLNRRISFLEAQIIKINTIYGEFEKIYIE